MKKLKMLLISAAAAAAATIACSAAASADETSGFWRYKTMDDGNITITSYTGFETDLTIPRELDGLAVTEISGSAFKDANNLTNVIIQDNITYIGYQAFRNSSVKSVTIPASVTKFGTSWGDGGTFAGCTNLKRCPLTLPRSFPTARLRTARR